MEKSSWTTCSNCHGQGKARRRIKKKVRLHYQNALELYEFTGRKGAPPTPPQGTLCPCDDCNGIGIIPADTPPKPNPEHYPNLAIIGGGIGGVALAVACLHRGIPFTLFERDENFDARSQGYGLTLQQASKAVKSFGINELTEGINSTRHVVHNTEGKVLGEWGMRKWLAQNNPNPSKRTNVHIARQSLRLALLEQLSEHTTIQWGHQFNSYTTNDNNELTLNFSVNENTSSVKADLLVGADGIRSVVRQQLIGENKTPLHHLGCIVILGICPLDSIKKVDRDLLDGATVFQTANGHERIYMMPYDKDSIMWQLSFPMKEDAAKALSALGKKGLKAEAIKRTQWHSPIPEIMSATAEGLISGYPVYDRDLLTPELLSQEENITLIGDAAHPMSPFKGQGANQALIDALALARAITKGCRHNWKDDGLRKKVLNEFEAEMLTRSAVKVKGSAEAAKYLHSDIVLDESNQTRGKCVK